MRPYITLSRFGFYGTVFATSSLGGAMDDLSSGHIARWAIKAALSIALLAWALNVGSAPPAGARR